MTKKNQETIAIAIRARVQKEMAKPRMAKSAREAEVNLVAARIAQGKL